MILKNKKVIFGLLGVGVVGGLATMTVLLLNKDASKNKNAKQEAIVKKNIDTSVLQGASFLVANKTIKLKASVTIPNEVEVKYFKGDQAPRDSDYGLAPTNLKADDFVFIKFFIKNRYQQTHQFPNGFIDFIKLKISAGEGFKIAIATRNLVPKSFAFSGSTSGVTIKPKIRTNIPPQVIVKYFKGSEQPNSDNAYKITEYLGAANNGEKVYIKFFIKSQYLATHFLPSSFTNPVQLTISGLKQLVNTRNLSAINASSFTISENDGLGTITPKREVNLPSELEMRYFKGLSAPNNDRDYTPSIPTCLSNNNKVYVKFFIKSASQSTHQLPQDFANNPIVITISGLPFIFNHSLFTSSGSSGAGTIALKSNANLPKEVEVRYVSRSYMRINRLLDPRRLAPKHYKIVSESNLSNGDYIIAKLFVKQAYVAKYSLPNKFQNYQLDLKFGDNNQINTINSQIDKEQLKKPSPTIRANIWKTASQVLTSDLWAPRVTNNLMSKIVCVQEKNSGGGGTVIATAEIYSLTAGTKIVSYSSEVSGFVPTSDWQNLQNALSDISASDLQIPVVRRYGLSFFLDSYQLSLSRSIILNEIKTSLKNKISSASLSNQIKERLKTLVDRSLIQLGLSSNRLQVTIKLGQYTKLITKSGAW